MGAKDALSSLLLWKQSPPLLSLIDYWAWRKHLHVPLLQHWKTKPKPMHSLETVFFKVYALLNNKHRYPQNHQSSTILLPIFPQVSMSAEVPNYFSGCSCNSLKTPGQELCAWSVGSTKCLCTAPLVLRDCSWKKLIYAESTSFQAMCPASLNALSSSASSTDRAVLALTLTYPAVNIPAQ